MSSLLRFPSNRVEKEQAGRWLARIDRGLTRAELDEIKIWLRDVRCRNALFKLAADWDSMAVVEELAEIFPLRAAEDTWRIAGRIAAGLAVAVIGATLWLHRLPAGGRTGGPIAPPTVASAAAPAFEAAYSTPDDAQRLIELPDHSTVRLNADTTLRVAYTAERRLLFMDRGEAMFQVAKDPGRVFTVRVGTYDFNAVGTAFDIRTEAPGRLRLTVTEGHVRVHRVSTTSAPAIDVADVLIEADKAVTIGDPDEQIDTLTAADVAAATSWQRSVLVFKAEPLAQVIAELNRYWANRFLLADPSLGKLPVTGYFNIADIDSVTAALEQNVGVKVVRKNNQLILTKSKNFQ